MSLIVQKFGGSSVANAERVMNVASIVTDTYAKGNDVVVVVSAQGDTTDDLIEKANEINPKASKREKDMLLAAGEQISISLLAMAIEKLGYHAVSLLGWQVSIPLLLTQAQESEKLSLTELRKSLTRRTL
jgi:aspartate kinase